MGPRSENRGYALDELAAKVEKMVLQWVHGPRTVVICSCWNCCSPTMSGFNGSTVREPWLSNADAGFAT